MSFAPVIPFDGYAGWRFLKRTQATQEAALAATSTSRRDEDYFRQTIGTIRTAEALVSDRRLLGVALKAFGLEADIGSKAFIRKVLEEGTLTPGALANRLADKQYRAFSAAFGFGDYAIPRTQLSDFSDRILEQYRSRTFETAVGEQNGDMRLALAAERELPGLAAQRSSDEVKWFTILGSKPLRKVFETALGMPSGFAGLDLDRQLGMLRDKADRAFGSASAAQFSDPAMVDKLIQRFLVRAQATSGASLSGPSAALTLLRQG